MVFLIIPILVHLLLYDFAQPYQMYLLFHVRDAISHLRDLRVLMLHLLGRVDDPLNIEYLVRYLIVAEFLPAKLFEMILSLITILD